MINFLESVNAVVWGPPMLLIFLFTALRFTIKGKFFQFTGTKLILKNTLGSIFVKKSNNGISQFSTFCSVLGACIGTGNIVGVATAIYSGGPGTVFWMVLSAFFSMMTAYAENYLGISYRYKDSKGILNGGAFSYIEKGVKMKKLSKIYAFFALMSALGMGNMAQSNSITAAIESSFHVKPLVTAMVSTVLCALVITGGIKRIARIQTVTVPVMTIFYIIITSLVLYKFKNLISPCIVIIFKEAFSVKALSGFGIYKAARYGISRGVFSNEAGLGSSTILHAQAEDATPENQGTWAMLEVFTDTIFMCGLTAIAILISTDYNKAELFGADLSVAAYGSIGEIGRKGIGLLTSVFAFASLASCSFYGKKSFEYLFGDKYSKIYTAIYIFLSFFGGINAPQIIWTLADIFNALMAIPNLFTVNCLADEVFFPSKKSRTLPQ